MVRSIFRSAGLATVLAVAAAGAVVAQAPQSPGAPDGAAGSAAGNGNGNGGRRGGGAGMGRVAGEVSAVNGNTITIRTEEGGTAQIVTTDNTRFMKEQGPVKLADLHLGDGLMAFGNMDAPNHTLHAAMVMAEDAAQVKAMRDNLGKTYITGRVTAVDLDDAKMTVERPDHVSQTIGFDETTSFKRALRPQRTADGAAGVASGNGGANGGGGGYGGGANGGGGGYGGGANGGGGGYGGGARGGGMGMMGAGAGLEQAFNKGESITLADIKVGDRVVGTGSVKGGVFVPVHLLESPGGGGRRREGAEPGASGSGAPAAGGSAATGPGGR